MGRQLFKSRITELSDYTATLHHLDFIGVLHYTAMQIKVKWTERKIVWFKAVALCLAVLYLKLNICLTYMFCGL